MRAAKAIALWKVPFPADRLCILALLKNCLNCQYKIFDEACKIMLPYQLNKNVGFYEIDAKIIGRFFYVQDSCTNIFLLFGVAHFLVIQFLIFSVCQIIFNNVKYFSYNMYLKGDVKSFNLTAF